LLPFERNSSMAVKYLARAAINEILSRGTTTLDVRLYTNPSFFNHLHNVVVERIGKSGSSARTRRSTLSVVGYIRSANVRWTW
jgi:hypothetical protein